MRNNNLTIILAIILIMLFSMAAKCSNRADDTVVAPFFGGIEGVVAVLETDSIGSVSDVMTEKAEVWEDESFPIEVRLMNLGEQDVDAHEVELEIKGISPADFSGIDFRRTNDDKIEKVSEFMPEGGISFVNFGDAHFNNLVGTHYDASIFVYFTYPYKTFINVPKVCFKENLRDNTICSVNGAKQAFASGGPLAVGTVEERFIGKGKILLEIPISNVQKGRVKAYRNDEFKPNFDEFRFEISDPDWDCSSRGNPNIARITHPYGQPSTENVIIRCINDNLEKDANFMSSVTLTLTYFYQDWIDETVRIRENPE